MVILSATKAGRAPSRILPGLVLHDEQGITAAAQSVLRDGAALVQASQPISGASNTA